MDEPALPPEHAPRPGPSPSFTSLMALFAGPVFSLFAASLTVSWLYPPPPSGPNGPTPEEVERAMGEILAQPSGAFAFVLPGQLTFLAIALLIALVSHESMKERLGLVRPRISRLAFGLILCGTPGLAGCLQVLTPLVGEPSATLKQLDRLIATPSGGQALLIAVLVGVLPAFCEELFFRGLILRRLARNWTAFQAIGLTSVVFALTHVDPQHAIFVLPLGLWFGWLCWATGSVWPAIAAHMLNNLAAMALAQWLPEGHEAGFPEAAASLGLIALGALGVSLVLAGRNAGPVAEAL